jgi:hypothetical protein
MIFERPEPECAFEAEYQCVAARRWNHGASRPAEISWRIELFINAIAFDFLWREHIEIINEAGVIQCRDAAGLIV